MLPPDIYPNITFSTSTTMYGSTSGSAKGTVHTVVKKHQVTETVPAVTPADGTYTLLSFHLPSVSSSVHSYLTESPRGSNSTRLVTITFKNCSFHSSAYGYSFFPTPFITETVLSPLCVLGTFIKS
jgi:hypothetical protein